MSRIGNAPVTIPEGVEVKLDGNHLTVKGPKGTLERDIHKNITVTIEDNLVKVTRPDDANFNKGLHGLTRTLIKNMIEGVNNEFTRKLQINGVGYRVQKQGNNLNLIVKGIDKELVGQTAAVIRAKRAPEVYGGKGIKYDYEVIRRKEGKAGKK